MDVPKFLLAKPHAHEFEANGPIQRIAINFTRPRKTGSLQFDTVKKSTEVFPEFRKKVEIPLATLHDGNLRAVRNWSWGVRVREDSH